MYISGHTYGSLGGTNAGFEDIFVSKLDTSGALLWTEQLGTSTNDYCWDISTDGMGNAYISAHTNGSLGGINAGGYDAIVAKYDVSGTLLWTEQLGTSGHEFSYGVSTDNVGNVYVSGETAGNLEGTNAGGTDAFISKYDASGSLLWTEQLGTSGNDTSWSVSADDVGNVYFTGDTAGGLGGTNAGGVDSFLVAIQDYFLVDTTSDTADANVGDGIAEDSSGNTSLRAAIQEANALGGPMRIVLAENTYSLTITGSDSSATNDLEITGDISIVGAGMGRTVINASGLNSDGVHSRDRIFDVAGSGRFAEAFWNDADRCHVCRNRCCDSCGQ